jgi:hypothetical protein
MLYSLGVIENHNRYRNVAGFGICGNSQLWLLNFDTGALKFSGLRRQTAGGGHSKIHRIR